ncbi:LysR family transcriptional regulator [Paenibacillus sp. y28]|uniref:LysR family transcriptional regulator n=1 Tax=Paenibacillus sp. y28 TaxID=3129110 RepID=UPI003016C9A8
MENLDEFAVVVEQQSLNRASRILNVSQPALSRKMMKLEEALGVQLFDRKGKRLELTRAGQICYEHATQVRELRRKFQQKLSTYKAVGGSKLTIGASLTTLQATLPDLITLYTRVFPQTDMKAVTGKTHEVVSLVIEKKVDLGLVASSIDHSGLTCVELFDDHLCLVLPVHHPLGELEPETLRITVLDQLPMILFSRGTWYRILMDELFHKHAIQPDVRMEIDSFEAIIRLVATTNTASLLPQSYLRSSLLEDNGIIIRNLAELLQTKRTTSLIYNDSEQLSIPAEQLIHIAKEHFRVGQDASVSSST